MKNLIYTGILFLIISADGSAQTPAASPDTAVSLREARELAENGEYLKALQGYEELLNRQTISQGHIRTIRKEYETLNLKILFSRFETPDSVLHTVAAGDNLYNLAQKYNTTIALVKKSNGLTSDVIYPGMKLKIQGGIFSVLVNRHTNTLKMLLNGKTLKHYRVATGENNSTPAGEFRIVAKLENPTWYHAGAVVPTGSPENILGTRWLGFDHKGYGIHGTTMPETIGQQKSAGCVRMFNQDVEELYDIIPVGTKVVVSD